jgi:hypothetical protein
MIKTFTVALAVGLGVATPLTHAASLDAERPLLCATTEAVECGALDEECFEGAPDGINVPQFVAVDIARKVIEERRVDGTGRRTVIENVKDKEGALILQGADGEYAWSAEIQKDTGKLVLTAAGDEVGFIVFGACIPD